MCGLLRMGHFFDPRQSERGQKPNLNDDKLISFYQQQNIKCAKKITWCRHKAGACWRRQRQLETRVLNTRRENGIYTTDAAASTVGEKKNTPVLAAFVYIVLQYSSTRGTNCSK